jgi:plasmid stabilization system protein ParE
MNVKLTSRAQRDIEAIFDYLRPRSPQGTQGVAQRLFEILQLLADQPHAGALSKTRRVRRYTLAPFPYVIYYRAEADFVLILGVRHGARRVPKAWG